MSRPYEEIAGKDDPDFWAALKSGYVTEDLRKFMQEAESPQPRERMLPPNDAEIQILSRYKNPTLNARFSQEEQDNWTPKGPWFCATPQEYRLRWLAHDISQQIWSMRRPYGQCPQCGYFVDPEEGVEHPDHCVYSDGYQPPVQSPIEARMLSAFQYYEMSPETQYAIGPYRADFAFPGSKVVVECDGHEYHDRTKEQAAHDRKRDRYMQMDGWMVLRFTGAEIHADAVACAEDVLLAISRRLGITATAITPIERAVSRRYR